MQPKHNINADQHTIKELSLTTNDGQHILYAQLWGNPEGTPIIYLHGGPGSGCSDSHKQLFDPKKHFVVFFDQRGAGRSTPLASMEANTTQLLIDDINLIAAEARMESFGLIGRSWGSTLALAYTIEHNERVKFIVTGGVFLGTQQEIDWIDKGHFKTFFPEVVEELDLDNLTDIQYAQMAVATLKLDDRYPKLNPEDFDNSKWIIERGYMQKQCFMPDNHITDNARKITCPVTIVQGRYDIMTPPIVAYRLHTSLSNSTLLWTIAGHSGSDRSNVDVTKAVISQL